MIKVGKHDVERRLIEHYKNPSIAKPSADEYVQEGKDTLNDSYSTIRKTRVAAGASLFGIAGAMAGMGSPASIKGSLIGAGIGAGVGAGLAGLRNRYSKKHTDEFVNSAAFDMAQRSAYNRLSERAQSIYKKADLIMNKIAAEDNRPKPGSWAKNRGVQRALRTEVDGTTNRFFVSDAYAEKKFNATGAGKGSLIGAGVGAGVGAALSAGGGARAIGSGALILGTAGAVVGAGIGRARGEQKAFNEYLGERGITRSWRGWHFTPEAAKKYIHQKYQGGGWDPKTRTSH